jgi:hypothetical protein
MSIRQAKAEPTRSPEGRILFPNVGIEFHWFWLGRSTPRHSRTVKPWPPKPAPPPDPRQTTFPFDLDFVIEVA